MRNNKKIAILCLLVVSIFFSSFPISASSVVVKAPEPTGEWYAPNGGTWSVTESDGSFQVLHPYKIVYITYDQLALIQSNKLTSGDLQSLMNLARDQGVAAVSKWLVKKLGEKSAAKFIPYIGYAVLAYDFFNAMSSLITDARFAQAIAAKHGIRIEYGTSFGQSYTAYDDWSTKYVSNPTGYKGTFTANS